MLGGSEGKAGGVKGRWCRQQHSYITYMFLSPLYVHRAVCLCLCRREDSDPRNIANAEIVSLRGFNTKVGGPAGSPGVHDNHNHWCG